MDSIRLQASYIVVGPDRVLHPGQLLVRNGRIIEVTQSVSQKADMDLGDVILLPGFVNCHTHLEFSQFDEPLPAGADFPEWIGAVVRHRRELSAALSPSEVMEERARSVKAGIVECFQTGTCLIADIVTPPWCADMAQAFESFATDDSPTACPIRASDWAQHLGLVSFPRIIACPEVIGLDRPLLEASLAWASELLQATDQPTFPLIRAFGYSPHAPYSLWSQGKVQLTADCWPSSVLTVMHVAESLAEREWSANGTGAFRQVFDRLGIPPTNDRMQISDALEILRSAPRSLLIHGNYLNKEEIALVAETEGLSVVYCPRTHAHFGHAPYPLSALQRAGVNVVIGTDSRASTPDLNLWSEMRAARLRHPDLSGRDAFAAITTQAAAALGCEQDFGSLQVGKLAFINVLKSPTQLKAAQLLECITEPGPQAIDLADDRIQPLSYQQLD